MPCTDAAYGQFVTDAAVATGHMSGGCPDTSRQPICRHFYLIDVIKRLNKKIKNVKNVTKITKTFDT